MSDSATPGWYHAQGDPPGTERFWDGTTWTEGPRPVGGGAPEAGFGTETPAADFGSTMPDTTMPDTTMPDTTGFSTETPAADFGSTMPETTGGFGSPAPGTPSGFGAPMSATPGNSPQDGFSTPPPASGFPGAPVAVAGGGGFYAEESQAQTALILAIVGALLCGPLAIVGAVMGNTERKAIDEGRRDPANRGKAMAALIVGGIVGVLTLLLILGVILIVIIGGASA